MSNGEAAFTESTDKTKQTLDELRAILLSEDRNKISQLEEKLQQLHAQVKDREKLFALLDPLTLDLLRKQMQENPSQLGEILGPAIGPAIRKQIASAKEDIVDALYPVIGQAIRKAVAEAMKNLARTVNQKLDQALSFRLFKARLKARLKGVSVDEAVLSEVLPFQVHEVFYIHKNSGLLLAHVSAKEQNSEVKDVISGMLTAIKNFAQNALGEDGQQQDLNVIEYDDFQIFLENGRYAFVAVVISGVPTDLFYKKVKKLERVLHKEYAGILRDFNGETQQLEGLVPYLAAFLSEFQKQESASAGAPFWAKAAVLAIFLFLLIMGFHFLFSFASSLNKKPATTVKESSISTAGLLRQLKSHLLPALGDKVENLRVIVDGQVLYLQGKVNNANDRIKIAQTVARLTDLPVIVNQLSIDSTQKALLERVNSTKILFAPGESKLSKRQKAKLQLLVPILKKITTQKIILVGRSDSIGSERSNFKISQQRARAVKDYLIQQGISADRIKIENKGSRAPLASNKSEQGRALNRSVTFRVVE